MKRTRSSSGSVSYGVAGSSSSRLSVSIATGKAGRIALVLGGCSSLLNVVHRGGSR